MATITKADVRVAAEALIFLVDIQCTRSNTDAAHTREGPQHQLAVDRATRTRSYATAWRAVLGDANGGTKATPAQRREAAAGLEWIQRQLAVPSPNYDEDEVIDRARKAKWDEIEGALDA